MKNVLALVLSFFLALPVCAQTDTGFKFGVNLGTYHSHKQYVSEVVNKNKSNGEVYFSSEYFDGGRYIYSERDKYTEVMKDYNWFNPGVYIYSEHFTAGVYYNSYRKTSVFLAYVQRDLFWGVDLTVGAVTGYPAKSVLPMVTLSKKFGNFRVSYLPPHKIHKAGVHLSYEF